MLFIGWSQSIVLCCPFHSRCRDSSQFACSSFWGTVGDVGKTWSYRNLRSGQIRWSEALLTLSVLAEQPQGFELEKQDSQRRLGMQLRGRVPVPGTVVVYSRASRVWGSTRGSRSRGPAVCICSSLPVPNPTVVPHPCVHVRTHTHTFLPLPLCCFAVARA